SEVGAAGRQLLERGEAGLERGHVLLARPHITGAALVLASRRAELRLPRCKTEPDRLEGATSACQRIDCGRTIRADAFVLATMIVLLDIELAERFADPLLLCGRVLHHMPHGHHRITG